MLEEKQITGLTIKKDILMVTINNVSYSSKTIATIFNKIAEQEVNVDMISQTSPLEGLVSVSFTAPCSQTNLINKAFNEIEDALGKLEVITDQTCVKLSVVGLGMRNGSGIAARIFRLFAEHDIRFMQVTTSEISISYTIKIEDMEKASILLSEAFNL